MKKIALVTGAGRGLGWELTRQLIEKGYYVIMGVRDVQKGLQARDELAQPQAAEVIRLDMEKPTYFSTVYDQIANTHGHLDVLVNNAGVMLDGDLMGNSAATILPERLKKTFAVNFFGIVELTNSLLPLLLKSTAPSIVNISSTMGSLHMLATVPAMPKTFAYNTSKAALNAYTLHLAALLSDSPIKVNAVHPGWVKTDMGGEAAPLEVADAVAPIIALIMEGEQAPTGRFLHQGQEVAW